MPAPNMFIVHVSDAPASARFYSDLFGIEPGFVTPGFIAYELDGGVQLALWNRWGGRSGGEAVPSRTGEVCVCLKGGPEHIDKQYEEWTGKGAEVVEEPHDAVFGRTFVVADPDGNLIRVAPVD
jgi:predicted enzyme related to lactoylglutathione lyase